MGKLLNIGSMHSPLYLDIDAIIKLEPRIEEYRDEDGVLKKMKCYYITTINDNQYMINRVDGDLIIKEKGLI